MKSLEQESGRLEWRRIAVGKRVPCVPCDGIGMTAWWFGGKLYRFDTCLDCGGRGSTVEMERWERGAV